MPKPLLHKLEKLYSILKQPNKLNFNETLQWMYAQLPMYQRQGKAALKKDLTNIKLFDDYLGYPSQQFKSLHIGGTNGKGSVSHLLASVLQEAGYKTGLYTSPHLKDFRERIRINGRMIAKNSVINFIKRHQRFLEKHRLSFFEMTVGMAFDYFAENKVDISVVEVGLGGRLDSTNIIRPEVSVITNIGFDHTQMLGETLDKIAFEKSGIIKKHTPVVIGRKQFETHNVFKQAATQQKAKLYYASTENIKDYKTSLQGDYQKENVATVLKTIEILRQKGFQISEQDIYKGLQNVVKNTGLRGRWEILQKQPMVIADTAHNKDGLQVVIKQLLHQQYEKLHIVISVVDDKDLKSILPLFPSQAKYYFTQSSVQRALAANQLQNAAQRFGLYGNVYENVEKAYKTALQNATKNDLVFVGGSTFTVADVLSL
jgi:dihydrofolate synthase/folylpolyglutamate synthase